MRVFFASVALLGLVWFSGCDTVADQQADAVRSTSQQDAGQLRDAHDEVADDVRNAAGKDWTGSAKSDVAEEAADRIESAGENTADVVEARGERKADQIEDDGK